jgi:hypothetical protein
MNVEKLFYNGMSQVKCLCYVLEIYLFNNVPEVYHHLKKFEVNADIYAMSWFVTLFAEHLSLSIVNKLWNLFLIKGWKIFIKFGISILCAFQL